MATAWRRLVKAIPGVRQLRALTQRRDRAQLKRLRTFVPYSAGSPRQLLSLALADADRAFPFLVELMRSTGLEVIEARPAKDFPQSPAEQDSAARLAEHFIRHGSDKSTRHDYQLIYGSILARGGDFSRILEVGLGTNNEDVASNMGAGGHPGASLRAFRDHLPDARIYGADIDRRILFTEERIATFFVDQLDRASFAELERGLPETLDLVIDDGLHSPAANLAVLDLAVRRLRRGGWVVVEDIGVGALPVWQATAALMTGWPCQLVRGQNAYLFVAQKP